DPVAATITAAADENIDEQAALDRAAAAADAAWEYFQTQAPRSWVPGYLADRRLDTLVAGYAPSGDRLIRDLHQQGYTDDELLAAGLAKADTRTGRLASRFHNRLMLPIHDTTGRVVAFIGRTHPNQAGDPPKYLNTPTTGLFRKHQLPYGLTPGALDRYRAGADLVIVEGPTDTHAVTTAAADQTTAGRPAPVVIAPLGTALTAGHLATLDDIAPLADRQVLVVLDNDPAGRAAARRAHRLLLDAGITTTGTITLPDRHDPAQLHADDPRALVDALQNPQPLADLVVEDIVATWMRGVRPGDWGCVEAVNALTDVAPIIARLPPGDRARLAIRVADTTGNDLITVIDHIEAQVPGRPVDVDPLGLPTPPRLRTVPDPPGAADPETAPSLRDRIRSIGTHVADVRAEGPGRKPLAKEQLPRQAHHREPHLGW
ncbi:MAG TPA: toprim domain-containing protein, partial [Nakamurella sp.]